MIRSNQPIAHAAFEAVRTMEQSQQSHGHQGDGGGGGRNVGETERSISIAAGAALGLLALTRPFSLRGLVLGVGAAALIKRGVSGSCEMYSALGVNTREEKDEHAASAAPNQYFEHGIHVEQSISINKPAQELYNFWRNFTNLPRVMSHLNSVTVADGNGKRSHWAAKAPLGFQVEWDAEIINDEPGKLIAWQSVGDATVDNSGSVRFLERGNGTTDVRVVLDYIPPAGKLGAMVARLFGESPDVQVADDLQKFKQQIESGEVATNANGGPRGS
jgi:uncharacterized membrane protein